MRIAASCEERQLQAGRRQKFPTTPENQTKNEAPGRVRSERRPKDEPIPASFDPRGLHIPEQWPPGHRKLGAADWWRRVRRTPKQLLNLELFRFLFVAASAGTKRFVRP